MVDVVVRTVNASMSIYTCLIGSAVFLSVKWGFAILVLLLTIPGATVVTKDRWRGIDMTLWCLFKR